MRVVCTMPAHRGIAPPAARAIGWGARMYYMSPGLQKSGRTVKLSKFAFKSRVTYRKSEAETAGSCVTRCASSRYGGGADLSSKSKVRDPVSQVVFLSGGNRHRNNNSRIDFDRVGDLISRIRLTLDLWDVVRPGSPRHRAGDAGRARARAPARGRCVAQRGTWGGAATIKER